VKAIVDQCHNGTEVAQEHAAATLRNVARTNIGRLKLVEEKGVPPLVAALHSSSRKHREGAASALANVALLPRYQVLVANEGAIPPLVAMLHQSNAEQEEAAAAIANIGVSIKNQPKLIAAKVIPRFFSKERNLA